MKVDEIQYFNKIMGRIYKRSRMFIKFDFSFVDLFIKNQNDKNFINHKSMDLLYSHYLNFNRDETALSKAELVQKTINSFSGKSIQALIITRDYAKHNTKKWKKILIKELKTRIPETFELKTTVYFSIGYEKGIVFDNDIVIDLSFSYYQQNPDEILYFILHELSHVVYLTYHKPLNYSLLKTRNDLLDLVRFNLLFEGLGMLFPYELRIKDENLMNFDYQSLYDPNYVAQREKRLGEIISELEKNSDQLLTERDWEFIDELSEKRIWYLIGAKMTLDVENNYGRDVLIKCIIDGTALFFELYNKIKGKYISNLPIQGMNILK